MINLRDLGGTPAAAGRVIKPGLLYRSGLPVDLQQSLDTGAEQQSQSLPAVEAVLDLRSAEERRSRPTPWPEAMQLMRDNVTGPVAVQPSRWRELFMQPDFGEAEAREAMRGVYERMPQGYSYCLKALCHYFLEAEQPQPVLIHCTAGKDRTGFIVAMLLTALSVPRDKIIDDFLASQGSLPAVFLLAVLGSVDMDITPEKMAALESLAGVDQVNLEAAFAVIESDFGSVNAYLAEMAGVGEAERERLQSKLLQPLS